MILEDKYIALDLRGALLQFRAITLKLMELLENEDYEELESLFDERQGLINIMNGLGYSQESFKEVCAELEIMPLEQKLNVLMNEKRLNVKKELDKVRATKTANRSYNKGYKVDSLFFNKKI